MLGNRVVLETLSGIARRRADAATGVRWDESTPMMAGRVRAVEPAAAETGSPAGTGSAAGTRSAAGTAGASESATVEAVEDHRDHERPL